MRIAVPIALATPLSQIVLSPGSAMTVTGLTRPQYQLLLTELGEDRASRLAYRHGVLEVRMPGKLHEDVQRLIHHWVRPHWGLQGKTTPTMVMGFTTRPISM